MGEWLQGKHLKAYNQYVPGALLDRLGRAPATLNGHPFFQPVHDFLNIKKRMGPSTHSALSRALLDFSNQLVPYLTEQRYAGRLIYSSGDDVLAYTNLWEWDDWLWDIRSCFKGGEDPHDEFISDGDYWRWESSELPPRISARPLFTMGHTASISFGIIIANSNVPLAIALENLWEAEQAAKNYPFSDGTTKDAVQVRVLYGNGNGNIMKTTAKFERFQEWRQLLNLQQDHPDIFDPALFEQAAMIWEQHPAPSQEAIEPWTNAFCSRRDAFSAEEEGPRQSFQTTLVQWLTGMYESFAEQSRHQEIRFWLKLAAFTLRKRKISCGGED